MVGASEAQSYRHTDIAFDLRWRGDAAIVGRLLLSASGVPERQHHGVIA